ncbi:hypothetical protein BJ322DRAFT_415384 [Thelephora terrestris]|uniref:XLF-like N-terminal domain-containing protein n=1 Tax=Thelephora terrestris TaxID=56493 RepID=A0A9P6LBI3_9AGAM|nr:hypothetical protein BJ322DRAFT_415384 [Thelephora terrestris]
MDAFDDITKRMLGKEWLAKVDNDTATPYLLKFHAGDSELSCSLMITDTKSVWVETLTSNQVARRWRECHPHKTKSDLTSRQEESWRRDVLKCLSAAHTIGNFAEMSFEVVQPLYSDFAFELRLEDFVFRWETNLAGYKISAEVISTQIIVPLMSTAHLAFNSPNPVGGMSESDLETALDKLGRAARRTPGMHTRNAISKPRLSTAIRRMTAMLNFLVELPDIQLDAEKLDITSPDSTRMTATSEFEMVKHSPAGVADIEMGEPAGVIAQPENTHTPASRPSNANPDDDSATENSEDEQLILKKPAFPTRALDAHPPAPVHGKEGDHSGPNPELSKEIQKLTNKTAASDSPPPPARPPVTKKSKRTALTISDSEESDDIGAGPSTRRGARQPIKRGGKRF